MITLNSRDELVEFLYGADSTSPDTLVGIATIGGELLAEALSEDNLTRDGINGYIQYFFPCGDEGEYIEVDPNGNIVGDWLYY